MVLDQYIKQLLYDIYIYIAVIWHLQMNQKCHEAKFGTRKPFCMHIFYLYHKLPKTGLLFNTNLRIAFKALFSFDSFFLLWTCVYFIHILRPPWALSCIALFICCNTKQCSLFLKSVDTAFVNFPFSAKVSRVFVSKTCFFSQLCEQRT